MKLAFSSLACPAWSWQQVLERGAAMGYEGIEWRLIDGNTVDASFPLERCGSIRGEMERRGLAACALDTSIQLAVPAGESQGQMAEQLSGLLAVAEALGAAYLRVFNGTFPPGATEAEALEWIVATLKQVLPDARRRNVSIALETHSFEGRGLDVTGVSDSLLCRDVVERLDSPLVGILWDVGNPIIEGESIEQTWENVHRRLAYLHVKDMKRADDGQWQYVVNGEGDLPLSRVVSLLRGAGFGGWLSYEWEKKWHPEIAEPETALPHFVDSMGGLLGGRR